MSMMEVLQLILLLVILGMLISLALRLKAAAASTPELAVFQRELERIEARMKADFASFRLEVQQQNTLLRREQHETLTQNAESLFSQFYVLRQEINGLMSSQENKLAAKLEEMRQTVDEKLQGTLEKRLGESFKQVGDRLEQVHKGLGEMQILANGVGDLKRVLTNVKSRGVWGEAQLEALLEQVLTPQQYEKNFAAQINSNERVEFAIKLPGAATVGEEWVYLPIDAKFPLEDYQRILEAEENGALDDLTRALSALENRIIAEAKAVCEKYICPPRTTDFAIIYLPTEGLFAEVMKRPGLAEGIKAKYKVVIAGPTTLWSILNSLQMGFRTLAIQQRSSEVWNTLAAVKTEWAKYGDVLDKVQKKLGEASNSIAQVQTRSNVVGRKLRNFEQLPEVEAMQNLGLD